MADGWWNLNGAITSCVGAYQAIGAADLAASYVNLVNPGTYNITNAGNAPTWNAESGWNFVAATQSKLLTGIAPGAASRSWSMIIRYSSASTDGVLMGYSSSSYFFIQPLRTGGVGYYNGTDGVTVSPQLAGGVLAIAGTKGYRDGTFDGNLAGNAGSILNIGVGWNGWNSNYITAKVQAVAIFNEALSAEQIATLTTRMNALSVTVDALTATDFTLAPVTFDAPTLEITWNTPPCRTLAIASESRVLAVPAEMRGLKIECHSESKYEITKLTYNGLTGKDLTLASVTFDAPKLNTHTQLTSMPTSKNQHGFTECGGKLYAIGGENDKKCYEYDIATNTWTAKADLPFAEATRQSAVVRTVGGKIYFIGGMVTGANDIKDEVYEFNPTINSWTEKTSMPTGREDMGSAVIDGKIYVFGGLSNTTPLKMLEVYDPTADSWDTTKADMPDTKCLGDFGAACGGKIYAIGSQTDLVGYPVLHPNTTVYCYDPTLDSWSTKSPIPVSTCYKEVEVIGTDLYVVAGAGAGTYQDSANFSLSIYKYDTLTDSWAKLIDAPYTALGSALASHDGHIYMCGGGYNGDRVDLWRLFS